MGDAFSVPFILSCLYHNGACYLFSLLKSSKLEIRFINIQPDTLTFTDDLILVNQILRNFRSRFKVLEYGILYGIT